MSEGPKAKPIDLVEAYERGFVGMTERDAPLDVLLAN